MAKASTQGAVSAGEFPRTTAEIAFFMEAYYMREALLAIPEDMDTTELKTYKKVVTDHVVSSDFFINSGRFQRKHSATVLQKTCVSTHAMADNRVPYLLGTVNYLQKLKNPTKAQLLEVLILRDEWRVFKQERAFLTSDIVFSAAIETCDMYWLTTRMSIHIQYLTC